jgi:hypothetical protein
MFDAAIQSDRKKEARGTPVNTGPVGLRFNRRVFPIPLSKVELYHQAREHGPRYPCNRPPHADCSPLMMRDSWELFTGRSVSDCRVLIDVSHFLLCD